MKKTIIVLALLFSVTFTVFSQPVRIAVGTDLQRAMRALHNDFKAKTGIEIEIIWGTASELAAQIKSDNSYDVFLSANTEALERLQKDKPAAGKPAVFAMDGIIVTARADVDIKNWQQLITSDEVSRIVIPDPDVDPYGKAAKQALIGAGLWDKVHGKIFAGESIAQVNEYIGTGAADVGFTTESQVRRGSGNWALPDSKTYDKIKQSIILLTHAQKSNYENALKFYHYLLSPEALEILTRNGYQAP